MNRAFTLLECLVALSVTSGSVLVINGLTRLMQAEMLREQNNQTQDWQLFCALLRSELAGSHFDKVENNFLYVTKGKAWRLGEPSGAADFRKSAANGQGYQPMLYGLSGTVIESEQNVLRISVKFDKGGERTFLYKFTNAPA